MKKMILTLAFALCAGLAAQAQVYSNTVGMIKHDLPQNGMKIISLPFPDDGSGVRLENALSGLSNGSLLYVWNNNTYTKYTYFVDFGWYEGFTERNDAVIPNGSALWLIEGGSGSAAIHTGTVPEDESIDVNIVMGLNMVSNPYPVSFTLGDIDTTGLTNEDVMFVWNGNSYVKYTYFETFGWYQGFTEANDVEISAGQGFWLNVASAGTLTFNKPY